MSDPHVGGIMYLQFIYQKGQLYKLRTLGRAHQMDFVQGIFIANKLTHYCFT